MEDKRESKEGPKRTKQVVAAKRDSHQEERRTHSGVCVGEKM